MILRLILNLLNILHVKILSSTIILCYSHKHSHINELTICLKVCLCSFSEALFHVFLETKHQVRFIKLSYVVKQESLDFMLFYPAV